MKSILKVFIILICLLILFIGLYIHQEYTKYKVCDLMHGSEFNDWWETQSNSINISQSMYCDYYKFRLLKRI